MTIDLNLEDGCGHPVKATRQAIQAAVLGDTNYVSTRDGSIVLTADEDSDDISLSVNDNHVESWSIKEELKLAIDSFWYFLGRE